MDSSETSDYSSSDSDEDYRRYQGIGFGGSLAMLVNTLRGSTQMPTFEGNPDKQPELENPIPFKWKAKDYLRDLKVPNRRWTRKLRNMLKGDARIWYERQKPITRSWDRFMFNFIREFNVYGPSEEDWARCWAELSFDPDSDDTIKKLVTDIECLAELLEFPDSVIITEIKRLFPQHKMNFHGKTDYREIFGMLKMAYPTNRNRTRRSASTPGAASNPFGTSLNYTCANTGYPQTLALQYPQLSTSEQAHQMMTTQVGPNPEMKYALDKMDKMAKESRKIAEAFTEAMSAGTKALTAINHANANLSARAEEDDNVQQQFGGDATNGWDQEPKQPSRPGNPWKPQLRPSGRTKKSDDGRQEPTEATRGGGGGRGYTKSPTSKNRPRVARRPINADSVRCWNCQEKGHYANNCDAPRKNTSHVNTGGGGSAAGANVAQAPAATVQSYQLPDSVFANGGYYIPATYPPPMTSGSNYNALRDDGLRANPFEGTSALKPNYYAPGEDHAQAARGPLNA
jgi:hypothetical protein